MSEQQQPKPKKEKKIPEGVVIAPKKKLSKKERRELQEAQRKAKAEKQQAQGKQAQQGGGGGGGETKQEKKEASIKQKEAPKQKEPKKLKNIQDDMAFSLFSHLPPYRDPLAHPDEFAGVVLGGSHAKHLHPSVPKLGLLYVQGDIRGGNARCRAMLHVFRKLIDDYDPPQSAIGDLRPHLDSTVLKPSFTYWTERCRPHSVSMGNAFTALKSFVASLPRDIGLEELKDTVREHVDDYLRMRIEYADKAIVECASSKIDDGDVLMVYGHSEVILSLLVAQQELGKKFRVICVDSRPLLEGRRMLKELRKANIQCIYILLNAVTYVMSQVTKVFLGASALMSNGAVLGRVGTAAVALCAQRKPVLVCCETYKISNRVQLESITYNELGDPKLVVGDPKREGIKQENLRALNLLYDLTPSHFISGIVTEMGIVPPTSVAVLLRELAKK